MEGGCIPPMGRCGACGGGGAIGDGPPIGAAFGDDAGPGIPILGFCIPTMGCGG